MKRLLILALCSAMGMATSQVMATPITIDGDLSDWGVSIVDGTRTNRTPSNFSSITSGIGLLGTFVEDFNDTTNSGYVGPRYGGQNYDAEFMGVARQGNMLYIGISTGQRPDNGFNLYSPGDIRFHMANGIDIGLEVGGGIGGGSGGVMKTGDAGSTYKLDSHGYTQGYRNAPQSVGSLMSGVTWINDSIGNSMPVEYEANDRSTLLGYADLVYTRNTTTRQHSMIELALDLSLFRGQTIDSVYWGPSCYNDVAEVELNLVTVPEPAAWMCLGIGLLGLGWLRKKAA